MKPTNEPPITEAEARTFIEAIWRALGVDVEIRRDPLDAEFVLEDILDAEEIG